MVQGFQFVGAWGPPQHRSTGGLEDEDDLPHPHPIPDPPPLPAWVQVWDGNSSNKLGHPLSQGWGPREGAGERVEEAAASFPLPCCLHPGDELAPGFSVFSPGQVCQGRRAGFCLVPVGIQDPVLLDVDIRGERSGSTEDPLGVAGNMPQLPCRAGRQSQAPLGPKA